MIETFDTKVVGTTFLPALDFSPLATGDPLSLAWEPANPRGARWKGDLAASVAVIHLESLQILGHLPSSDSPAAWLVIDCLTHGGLAAAAVSELTGGTAAKQNRGINVQVQLCWPRKGELLMPVTLKKQSGLNLAHGRYYVLLDAVEEATLPNGEGGEADKIKWILVIGDGAHKGEVVNDFTNPTLSEKGQTYKHITALNGGVEPEIEDDYTLDGLVGNEAWMIVGYKTKPDGTKSTKTGVVRLEPVLRETPPTTPPARKAAKAPPPRPAEEIEI